MNSLESMISLVLALFYVLWIAGGLYVLYTLQRLRQENAQIKAQLLEIQERLHTEFRQTVPKKPFPEGPGN